MKIHDYSCLFCSHFWEMLMNDYTSSTWAWIGLVSGVLGALMAVYLILFFVFVPIKRDIILARKNYWIWVAIFLVSIAAALQLWGEVYCMMVSVEEDISVSWNMLIYLFGSSVDPDRLPEAGLSYMLMTWIKLFVFNGILVATLVGLFDRRINHYKDGNIRYSRFLLKSLRNRYAVVIGSNEVAASVIKTILNNNAKNTCEYIFLQTTNRAEDVRRMLEAHLNDKELDKIIIYTATRDSENELRKLHLAYASEIYILGEQTVIGETETHHDTMNMRCLNLMAKILMEYKRSLHNPERYTRKICRVMFEYQTTHSVFQFSDVREDVHETLDFIPFNRYECWARKVLVDNMTEDHGVKIDYTPLDGYEGIDANSDKHAHLVVVGMSKMGIAMGVQALLQAHYMNYVKHPDLRTRITFIDTNADKEMACFKGRYATLFELVRSRYLDTTTGNDTGWVDPMLQPACQWKHLTGNGQNFLDVEVEFVKGDVESDGVRQYLQDAAADKQSKLTIAVCLTHAHQAVAASLYMPIGVYTSEQLQQIWVYQREAADVIYNIAEETKGNSVRYKKLRPFGMLYADYMDDMSRFWRAVLVNAVYGASKFPQNMADSQDATVREVLEAWHSLKECKKISNKLFADSMCQKLRCVMRLKPQDIMWGYRALFREPEFEARLARAFEHYSDVLSICEHNRWNVEQLMMGFAPILKQDDDALKQLLAEGKSTKALKNELKASSVKVHPNICDFDHLDEIDPGSKEYDTMLNNAIPRILSIVFRSMRNRLLNA